MHWAAIGKCDDKQATAMCISLAAHQLKHSCSTAHAQAASTAQPAALHFTLMFGFCTASYTAG